jgi:LysM repeat protein
VTDERPTPGAGPAVCPFVALAEDRDRRADGPDEHNRCYAERAPRRRDLVYQSEYCYAPEFARCPVFLAWAARNVAEPAGASGLAGPAWTPSDASGEGARPGEPHVVVGPGTSGGSAAGGDATTVPTPSPEGGLFGPAEPGASDEPRASEQLDWVSASAWAEAPWDERAEREADELETFEDEDWPADEPESDESEEAVEEATRAPRVPAALPMRKRKPPLDPIRSTGSGEWYYADPPAREPLVSRQRGIAPPLLLGVLGLLLVSIIVFLLATQLGGPATPSVADASPTLPTASQAIATRAPATTLPTEVPSPSTEPKQRFYRVKAGDSLSAIAARFGVSEAHLQCINHILNKNVITIDQRLEVPPAGFSCPAGWRRATPAP